MRRGFSLFGGKKKGEWKESDFQVVGKLEEGGRGKMRTKTLFGRGVWFGKGRGRMDGKDASRSRFQERRKVKLGPGPDS